MRVGIIFTGDYSWAGGLYYSLNIIKLLQEISLHKKLQIIVFINRSSPEELTREIRLPNVKIVDLDQKPFIYKAYCKFLGLLSGENIRFVKDINAGKVDILYPLINYDKSHSKLKCKVYYWLYDFQHKFLPELFSREEIEYRDKNFKLVTNHASNIVVSSHDSKNHLKQFYPDCKAIIDVYNFVSLIEKRERAIPQLAGIKIPQNYLVVCNQFWPHKNHKVVLEAISYLVKKQKQVFVVFTGKYNDERNRKYVASLQEFISDNHIEPHIAFTGFISREDQIALMQNARAVIQPSRFEGWSTVIEDAKALTKFLIVSDLPIHREQVLQAAEFFNTDDPVKLADHMERYFNEKTKDSNLPAGLTAEGNQAGLDYKVNIEKSKSDLLSLFNIS
jgi:glycosyltransferase involved in cell wall biosynthesis